MFVSPLSHDRLHFLLLFVFGSPGLDEVPGEDADPLQVSLGCCAEVVLTSCAGAALVPPDSSMQTGRQKPAPPNAKGCIPNLYKFIKVEQKVYSCENKLTTCTD